MTEARHFKSIFSKSIFFKYAALAILPLGVLLFWPAANFATLTLGTRVLLETKPVDPRDFLRGDYVVLDYAIADVPDVLFPEETFPGDKWSGATVYVTLALDDAGIASAVGASLSRPESGLYIKGRREYYWRSVDYGLGVYYVPEGTGRELEEAIQDPDVKVLADVRILWGHGVIKELEIVKQTQVPVHTTP
jgi:uncharacterized membrane-anchored protein